MFRVTNYSNISFCLSRDLQHLNSFLIRIHGLTNCWKFDKIEFYSNMVGLILINSPTLDSTKFKQEIMKMNNNNRLAVRHEARAINSWS